MFWKLSHNWVYENFHGQSNMLWIVFVAIRSQPCFISRPTLDLTCQLGTVLKTIGFILQYPPIIFVDFHMVPSTPSTGSDKQQRNFPKGRNVIEVIIQPDVLQEFNSPCSIVGLFWPPRTFERQTTTTKIYFVTGEFQGKRTTMMYMNARPALVLTSRKVMFDHGGVRIIEYRL